MPGVAETGPANLHFVRDIGLGFLATAASLALAARRGAPRGLLVPALVFLGGHAGLRLAEMAVHAPPLAAVLRDLALVVAPGLLPALGLWRRRRAAESLP